MCFDAPYIGVRGACESDTPTSGLYINDLPGITFKRGTMAANAEDLTAKAMFERLSTLAVDHVKNDFIRELSSQYQFNRVLNRHTYGYYEDDEVYSVVASGLGLEIERCIIDPFTSIYVESVDIWTQTIEEVQFTVTDGVNTELCDVTTNADGITNVRLDFESKQEKIYITFDGATVRQSTWDKYCYDYCKDACGVFVRGYDSGNYTGTFYGLRPRVQERCDKDALFCQYEELLRYPILYQMGIRFLQEAIHTDRYNPFVVNAKESLEQLMIEWNGGLDVVTGVKKRGEYWRQLYSSIDQMKHSLKYGEKSRCLTCKSARFVDSIP